MIERHIYVWKVRLKLSFGGNITRRACHPFPRAPHDILNPGSAPAITFGRYYDLQAKPVSDNNKYFIGNKYSFVFTSEFSFR